MRPFFVGQPPLGMPFRLNRTSPQARGLVAWWPTVPSRGGVRLFDLSGRNQHATMPGGTSNPTFVADAERGVVLNFDGSNDYINVSGASIPSQYGSHTAWLRIASYGGRAFESGTGGNDYNWFTDNTNHLWGFFIGGEYRVSKTQPSTGAWVHICLTWDQSGSKLYYNGVLQGTNGSAPPAYNQTGFYIGGSSGAYNGRIDDIRLYNRALSAAEVLAMYLPQTRWELYEPLGKSVYYVPPVVAGQPTALRQSQILTGVRRWGRGL